MHSYKPLEQEIRVEDNFVPSHRRRVFHRQLWSGMDEVLLPVDHIPNHRSPYQLSDWRIRVAFWILGLCSGAGYVIMVAGAKDINSGGVGIVFLCDIAPGFFIKLTAPYWFHMVSHSTRVIACSILMILAFSLVGCGSNIGVQLVGVSLSSIQSSLGEATFLSLSARYDSRWALTMWSSGTGMAGVFGYAYVYLIHVFWGLTFRTTLLLANLLGFSLLATFFFLLGPIPSELRDTSSIDGSFEILTPINEESSIHKAKIPWQNEPESGLNSVPIEDFRRKRKSMTFKERLKFVGSLWPYMLPLGIVYFAEYCMQSGTWGAIGFPITSESARKEFYLYANWMYQLGVFISRSSAMVITPSRFALQVAMPFAQVLLLIFFYADAIYHFWYNYTLLLPCLLAGLLGGSVYVGTFILLANDVVPDKKELALGAASIADTIGICFADMVGLYIQSCVYKSNGISGATVQCFL